MNEICKVILSLSLSGTGIILGIFLFCRIFRKKLSRRWQYYIWLVAVARLLLPFSGEINLVGHAFTEAEQYAEWRSGSAAEGFVDPDQQEHAGTDIQVSVLKTEENNQKPVPAGKDPAELQNAGLLKEFTEFMGILWLSAAVLLLLRKILSYQSFVRSVRAGGGPAEPELLERFGQIAEEMQIKGTVELYINPRVSSPLLAGCLRPMVVLPSAELSEPDFRYTVLHELTHYRRMDILYKWLVQFTICLHWFNPFVPLLGHAVDRACELACDEAVIQKLTEEEKRTYGDVLLRAANPGSIWKSTAGAVTLHESGRLLKGRLKAIMEERKQSKWRKILSLSLILIIAGIAAVLGVYAGSDAGKRAAAGSEEEKAGALDDDGEALRFTSGGNDFLLKDGTPVIERDQVIYILCDGLTEDEIPLAGAVNGTMIMVVHRGLQGPQGEQEAFAVESVSVTLPDDRSYIQEEAEEICLAMLEKGTLSDEDAERIMDTAWELQKRAFSEPQESFSFSGSYYQSVYYRAPWLFYLGYDLTEEAAGQYAGTELALEDGEQLRVFFADSDQRWMEEEEFLSMLGDLFSEFRRRTGKRTFGIQRPIISHVESVGYDVESLTAGYYAEEDMGGFASLIQELSGERQKEYLEKAYEENNTAVFAVVLGSLEENGDLEEALLESFLLRAYTDGEIAFFCILADHMSEEQREEWHARLEQTEDGNSSYIRTLALQKLLDDEW